MGHGYVVQVNTAFYNNLNKSELFAQLVEIANATFSPAVERFRKNYGIRMNPGQFDALTSFVFNCGVGTLDPYYGFCRALLNAVDPSSLTGGKQVSGTLNVSGADVYSSASLSSQVVASLGLESVVTVFGYQAYRSGTQQVGLVPCEPLRRPGGVDPRGLRAALRHLDPGPQLGRLHSPCQQFPPVEQRRQRGVRRACVAAPGRVQALLLRKLRGGRSSTPITVITPTACVPQ